jgi:hypothetical protein
MFTGMGRLEREAQEDRAALKKAVEDVPAPDRESESAHVFERQVFETATVALLLNRIERLSREIDKLRAISRRD